MSFLLWLKNNWVNLFLKGLNWLQQFKILIGSVNKFLASTFKLQKCSFFSEFQKIGRIFLIFTSNVMARAPLCRFLNHQLGRSLVAMPALVGTAKEGNNKQTTNHLSSHMIKREFLNQLILTKPSIMIKMLALALEGVLSLFLVQA